MVSPLIKPEEISQWLDIPTLHMHYKHDWNKLGTQNNHLEALKDYFNYNDLSINYNVLFAEAKFLGRIFPNFQANYIIKLLRDVGNEPNRIRVVAKKLCLKLQNDETHNGSSPNNTLNNNHNKNKKKLVIPRPERLLTHKRFSQQPECSENSLLHKKSKYNFNENIKHNNITVNNFELKKAIENAVSKIDQKTEIYIPEVVKSISEIKVPEKTLATINMTENNIKGKQKDPQPQQSHSLISFENETNCKEKLSYNSSQGLYNSHIDSLNMLSSKSNNSNLNQIVLYPEGAHSEQIETVTSTTKLNDQNASIRELSSTEPSNSTLETYQPPLEVISQKPHQNQTYSLDNNLEGIFSSDRKEKFKTDAPITTTQTENYLQDIFSSDRKEKFKTDAPITTTQTENYLQDIFSSDTKERFKTDAPITTMQTENYLQDIFSSDRKEKFKTDAPITTTQTENKNVPFIIVPSTSKDNFVPSFNKMLDENINKPGSNNYCTPALLSVNTNNSYDNFPTSTTPTEMKWLTGIMGSVPKMEENVNTPLAKLNEIRENTKVIPKSLQTTPAKSTVNVPRIMDNGNVYVNIPNKIFSPIDLTKDIEEEDVQLQYVLTEDSDTNPLVYQLMEIFPEACPNYLRMICKNRNIKPTEIDTLISEILSSDYPRRKNNEEEPKEIDVKELSEHLKELLPDADPTYLDIKAEHLADKPNELKLFISNAFEHHDYPTMKDYLRRVKLSSQQKQYTTDFAVENFLDVIPDPIGYFRDPLRKSNVKDKNEDIRYVIAFLKNKFPQIPVRIIHSIDFSKFNLIKVCQLLKSAMPMKSKRKPVPLPQLLENIPLLQEIAFIQHEEEILSFIKVQKAKEEQEREVAKQNGLLQTCQCCFDDEVMPKDVAHCNQGCVFCKSCVSKSIEVAFGDGKLQFPCLTTCTSEFSLQTLQNVLNPKIFSKIALKKQVEEVKAAGIEDLESCPFCDFVTIPDKEDKLFRCLNPSCMKESCRQCKESSHVPLRCDEVEKDEDVKARVYIENKMAEALMRKCYKCGLKFVKSEGCNKMTCSCGATMCYICNKPVTDYKHFNGQGGTNFDLCPLYSDTDKLHVENVLKSANEAKAELGKETLKIDPTADLQKHYNINKKNKLNHLPRHVDPFAAMNHAERLLQLNRLRAMIRHGHHQGHRHRHHYNVHNQHNRH